MEFEGRYFVGGKNGEIIDYSVQMRKLDRSRQMDVLLANNQVTASDIANLANKIATFHKNTRIIFQKDFLDVQEKFNDLDTEREYLQKHLKSNIVISQAIEASNRFIENVKGVLAKRLRAGYFRDCHGDLHCRNIFLLPFPQPFDCIEFNDDYRQIDVLNEIAFLCMDLDAFGRQDLSDLFLKHYNNLFPCIKTETDRRLFIYYKSYRSNIRAKVNSLRARDATNNTDRTSALSGADKYLHLMDHYIKMLAD